MKAPRITVISIPVADQAKAKAFYVEKLGFVVKADADMGHGSRWIQLAPSAAAETSIALVNWFKDMKPGSVQGLVLDVPDLAAARKALQAKGVATDAPSASPWGTFSNLHDPDGNGWMLHQP